MPATALAIAPAIAVNPEREFYVLTVPGELRLTVVSVLFAAAPVGTPLRRDLSRLAAQLTHYPT